MSGRPTDVATHLLAECSSHAEALLDAAERVRAREDDAAVHDLRVATRRLAEVLSLWRSALDPSPARRARRGLDRVRRALGPVREHEVHSKLLAALLEEASAPTGIAARALQSKLRGRLERDHHRAVRGARARRIAWILTRVERATAGVAGRLSAIPALVDDAATRVEQRVIAARAALHEIPAGAGDDALHRARVAAKKARYALECMTAIGVSDDQETMRAFRRAQRDLGKAHDWATLLAWIERERVRRLRRLVGTTGDFDSASEYESLVALAARVAELEARTRREFRVPPAMAQAPSENASRPRWWRRPEGCSDRA